MNLLRKGSDWLQGKRHSHMSTSVVYRRGAVETELNATVGRSRFEAIDESGSTFDLESQDFIVRAEDIQSILAASSPNVPMKGDEIDHVAGSGVTQTFEVMAPPGEPVFKYEDEGRLSMRIHTKQVSE